MLADNRAFAAVAHATLENRKILNAGRKNLDGPPN